MVKPVYKFGSINLLSVNESADFDTEKEIREAQIEVFIEAAFAGPNWINGQHLMHLKK
ncbi:hypothetical protein [Neobacillus drentensis]|uniref:hypothetical protein n=1 Tax=Neobacillus drentensis TaxID=220684 RepID=UPI002FFD6B9A